MFVLCRFSSVPTQRPAVSGLLHAALAHGDAAVVWPRSPGKGGGGETEVRATPGARVRACRTALIETPRFRYMEDVPALLEHCFGKKNVSGESRGSV